MSDEVYMQYALELAKKTIGQTSPNPVVGAVVVKNNQIVGFGAHLYAGDAHAEVHAINMAKEHAKDATLYVTLEPCSHHGKTPPCTELIINSGIKRVVIATRDPNERVSGINPLREAGIEVETGILEKEASDMNQPFFHYIQTKRPYITLKTATSFDGKTATKTGESKWITGEEARFDAHTYRHTHDAILVGVNTVITDNPSLTTRLKKGGGRNPIRIILDTHLRTPPDAKVISDGQSETWIFVGKHVTEKAKQCYEKHKQVRIIQLEEDKVHINKMLEILGEKGVMSLFVEGGATVNGAFLQDKIFNRLVLYMAPMLIGGDAPSAFLGKGFASLTESPSLSIKKVEQLGTDLKIEAMYEGENDVHGNY